MTAARVAVIGAGWAGLAAAVALQKAGVVPTLIEAARQVGGRARRVDWVIDGAPAMALDNGQHILLGAYHETLGLMRSVGVDPDAVLVRRPVALSSATGFRFVAPRLPAPWHVMAALLTARGLTARARIALARLMLAARRHHWRVEPDLPLAQWLAIERQPEDLIRNLWYPLCVAALNTPAAIASTQVFLNVLRDSLGAQAAASDLLLPRVTLDELVPHAALAWLERGGAVIELGRRVTGLARVAGAIAVTTSGEVARSFDGVVLAVPGHQVSALLSDPSCVALASLAGQCDALTWQPIATVYLRYRRVPELPFPMMALGENPDRREFGQWLFDKGRLGAPAGLVAVVISAAGAHQEFDHADLAAAVAAQLARQLNFESTPLAARVISEKRATFACVPGMRRPPNRTAWEELVVAGDYTQSDYPATLESAVQSGNRAAALLLSAHTGR